MDNISLGVQLTFICFVIALIWFVGWYRDK